MVFTEVVINGLKITIGVILKNYLVLEKKGFRMYVAISVE